MNVGAVVAHPVERHSGGECRHQRLGLGLYAPHNLRRVGLALLGDLDDDGTLAVEVAERLHPLGAVAERGDVPQVDARAGRAKLDCAQVVGGTRLGVERNRFRAPVLVDFSGRNLHVAASDLVDDLRERQTFRGEFAAVDVDDDFALLAADQLHRGDARKRREAAGELVVRVVVEVAALERPAGVGGKRHRHHGRSVDVELRDRRLLRARRQVVHYEVYLLAHVGRHHVNVAVEVELQHHLAEVVRAGGRHVL